MLIAVACSDPCRNTIVRELPSPDGRWRAVAFERSCGATTGFSTQVSVLSRAAPLEHPGNVLTADTNNGKAPAAAWGGPEVAIQWISADSLEVGYDARARTFTRVNTVDGVGIRFVLLR